jgi:hypothetical protein
LNLIFIQKKRLKFKTNDVFKGFKKGDSILKFNQLVAQFSQELNRALTRDEYKMVKIAYDMGKQNEFEETIEMLNELNNIKKIQGEFK